MAIYENPGFPNPGFRNLWMWETPLEQPYQFRGIPRKYVQGGSGVVGRGGGQKGLWGSRGAFVTTTLCQN